MGLQLVRDHYVFLRYPLAELNASAAGLKLGLYGGKYSVTMPAVASPSLTSWTKQLSIINTEN